MPIDKTEYVKDPYRAGAAEMLNVPPDQVTKDERVKFKRAWLRVLHTINGGPDLQWPEDP